MPEPRINYPDKDDDRNFDDDLIGGEDPIEDEIVEEMEEE